MFLSLSSGLYNHEMMLECAKIFSFIKMITCYLSLSSLMGSIAICWSTSVKLPPEILRGSQLDHAEWWLLMCSQILFSTVFLGFSTNVHYRDGLLSFFSVIVTYIHLSLVSGRLNNTVLNDDWIIKEIMKKNLKFRNSRNKWKWKHIQNLPKKCREGSS